MAQILLIKIGMKITNQETYKVRFNNPVHGGGGLKTSTESQEETKYLIRPSRTKVRKHLRGKDNLSAAFSYPILNRAGCDMLLFPAPPPPVD